MISYVKQFEKMESQPKRKNNKAKTTTEYNTVLITESTVTTKPSEQTLKLGQPVAQSRSRLITMRKPQEEKLELETEHEIESTIDAKRLKKVEKSESSKTNVESPDYSFVDLSVQPRQTLNLLQRNLSKIEEAPKVEDENSKPMLFNPKKHWLKCSSVEHQNVPFQTVTPPLKKRRLVIGTEAKLLAEISPAEYLHICPIPAPCFSPPHLPATFFESNFYAFNESSETFSSDMYRPIKVEVDLPERNNSLETDPISPVHFSVISRATSADLKTPEFIPEVNILTPQSTVNKLNSPSHEDETNSSLKDFEVENKNGLSKEYLLTDIESDSSEDSQSFRIKSRVEKAEMAEDRRCFYEEKRSESRWSLEKRKTDVFRLRRNRSASIDDEAQFRLNQTNKYRRSSSATRRVEISLKSNRHYLYKQKKQISNRSFRVSNRTNSRFYPSFDLRHHLNKVYGESQPRLDSVFADPIDCSKMSPASSSLRYSSHSKNYRKIRTRKNDIVSKKP